MIKKLLLILLVLFSYDSLAQITIDFEDFESGTFDGTIWNDGGSDCQIINSVPPNNSYSVELTDGANDPKHTTYSDELNLTAYYAIDITFDFQTSGYINNDDFYLEYSTDGSNWEKIGDFNLTATGTKQFVNGTQYLAEKVSINTTTEAAAFTTATQFRFRGSAVSGPDEFDILYIDNIIIEGYFQTSAESIQEGGIWAYNDSGTDLGTAWRAIAYDDSSWEYGISELGYSDNNNEDNADTDIGQPAEPRPITTYFRKDFTVVDKSIYTSLNLAARRDDGMVVYLNGVEVWRDNMSDPISFSKTADNTVGDGSGDIPETVWISTNIPTTNLIDGTNVIAVEIHQKSNTSSDIRFNFKLTGLVPPAPTSESIPENGNWWYSNIGSAPPNDIDGDTWLENDYDNSTWSYGFAELGYGDGDEETLLNNSPQPQAVYFRKEFTIADHTIYNSIDLRAIRDDGVVVYLNGNEIWRDKMPSGTPTYATEATDAYGTEDEWQSINVSSTDLITGTNIIAVEVHNKSLPSSDLSFNFELSPSTIAVGATQVSRKPYLQKGTPTSVVVKWRTSTSETGTKINYGTDFNALTSVQSGGAATDHEVELTGLSPNTKYYYEIEDDNGLYIAKSTDMFVKTSPAHGTKQFVRAWILGDAGVASEDPPGTNQQNVRDAYYDYVNNTNSPPVAASSNIGQTDMMLFLGDNAYPSGTDAQFQIGLFDIYNQMLKKTVAWSCLGNHETYGPGTVEESPYYDIFTFPTAGEAGGNASGTEAYYSFDYANIHFIILESMSLHNDAGQISWLTSDIQNTTQDWIIAFWHHPPYTKGSHNSDSETQLVAMRNNYLSILESNGIDLVLNGHSHSYERSYFINGHYGLSNTFLESHKIQTGDGKPVTEGGDGEYLKTTNTNGGTVYVVTGSAGKISGGNLNHPAMYTSQNQLGSSVIEIDSDGGGGQNLTLKFITDTGTVNDYFTINKSASTLSVDTYEVDNNLIKLYPVPANSFINIDINTDEILQKVEFYNAIGSLVKVSKEKTINVRTLSTGMYMVQIITNKNRYYKSIIIE